MRQIKRLSSGDQALSKALIDLFQQGKIEKWSYPPETGHLDKLLADPNFIALAALEDGKLIGGLSAYRLPMLKEAASKLLLYEIGVESIYRRQGIGKILIEELKSRCRDWDVAKIIVLSSRRNRTASGFYQRTGADLEPDTLTYSYIL